MNELSNLEGLLENEADSLRYVLNFADSKTRVSTVMKAFTLPDRITNEERLERLYAALPSLIARLKAAEEALEAADDVLRNYACHGGEAAPCLRTEEQCRADCGKYAGDVLLLVEAARALKESGS